MLRAASCELRGEESERKTSGKKVGYNTRVSEREPELSAAGAPFIISLFIKMTKHFYRARRPRGKPCFPHTTYTLSLYYTHTQLYCSSTLYRYISLYVTIWTMHAWSGSLLYMAAINSNNISTHAITYIYTYNRCYNYI